MNRKYKIYNNKNKVVKFSNAIISYNYKYLNGNKNLYINFDNKINLCLIVDNNKLIEFKFNKRKSILNNYFEVNNINIHRICII